MRAAQFGPLIITDRGRRSHVLLTAADHDRPVNGAEKMGTRLRMYGHEDIDLELPERSDTSLRVSEL